MRKNICSNDKIAMTPTQMRKRLRKFKLKADVPFIFVGGLYMALIYYRR